MSTTSTELMAGNDQLKKRTQSQRKDLRYMASAAGFKVARLSVNIPESARAEVDELIEKSGRSITDLVRFGLSLVKVVLHETKLKHKIVVTTEDGKPIKELIIPGL